MNYQRKTLLAGIAALALVAGTGVAPAQETPKDQGSQSKPPHATQQMNQAPGAKTGQNAPQENRGTNSRAEQNAAQGEHKGKAAEQQNQHNGPAAQQQNEHNDKAAEQRNRRNGTAGQQQNERNGTVGQQQNERTGTAAQQQNEHNGTAAQQQNQGGRENNAAAQRERNGMQGLQGNATGMHAQLTDEQRTRIRNTVILAAGAPRVGHVDFDVTVGTAIPRGRIHVIPVPEMLVQIEPEWRGFLYFVYEDEVVIVNPSDMRIVAVIPA
jgi:hypothetical protein